MKEWTSLELVGVGQSRTFSIFSGWATPHFWKGHDQGNLPRPGRSETFLV